MTDAGTQEGEGLLVQAKHRQDEKVKEICEEYPDF